MKKFYLLTKTLLVAVCLLAGASNVWGTDVTVNTTDNFNYSNGTCLDEAYTDGGSAAKDAIGILVKGDTGNRSGTLSFGTTTTADKILLTANFLISTGNSNESNFKVIDQAGNEIFAFSIGGGSTVTLTDYSGQSTAAGGITTERTKVDEFGGNQYYKTRWTAVSAYLDFTKHYGVVSVGSGKYEIQISSTSTGVKGFVLTGGKSYGASLVAKDYATTEVTGRYEAGMDVLSANTGGTDYKADYTDYNSVTKNAVGIYAKPNISANRYGTLTLGAITSANYINVSGNFVLETGNNDGSTTYLKAIDQSGDEIFAIRMTGNNTTSVKLTDSDNTDGTEVMTVTKRKDSTIGNGSSTYGLTAWTSFNAELNFADHKGSVTIGSTTYSISLKSTSTGIKGFALQAGRGYGAALLSSDYSVSVAAGPVTVKYVDGDSNEIAAATTLSVAGKLPDETLGFYSPKFITYEGDLYIIGADASATNPTTNQSVKLTSSAQDKYITYTKKAEGTYYFYEFDGGYTTRANNESNGSAQTKSASVTVPATGVYVVTANCYGSNSGRYADMKVGETTIVESTLIGIYAPGTNLVSNNVLLEKDDVITITTTSSIDGIDYVILQKVYDVTDPSKIVGAVDKSSAFTQSDVCTLKKGDTKVITFTNHGYGTNESSETNSYYNWTIGAYDGATQKAFTRADFWDNEKGATTGYDEAMSTDGGSSKTWVNWDKFQEDMDDATVVATLSYSLDGTYSISAVQTGHVNNYIYYVDHSVSELTADELAIKLGIEYSWSEVLSVEQTAVSSTITPAGWSTFASPYALDLSTISGGQAYYASDAEGSTVTLTTTNATVPAGEGIMVKGTPGETFTINVVASGTAISGNLLKGQTTTGNVAASTAGKYHYVFGYEMSESVVTEYGFYNLDAETSVPAGKAYLETTTELGSASARAISIVLADDILTGINEAEAATEAVQKEGKFVVDGKLVIFKKGMKFNANGARIY